MPRCTLLAALALLVPLAAQAGTPTRGVAYVGAAFGAHHVHRVVFDYDGDASLTATSTILATLPTAADALVVPGGTLVVAGQGSNVHHLDPATGVFETRLTGNNGNAVSLDPSGRSVWIGWTDSSLSQVPLQPFGNGIGHSVTGDDATVTSLAFTPSHGVFYANGGEGPIGAFGRIDMATFTTSRLRSAAPATTVHYDAFSRTLILASAGRAEQVDPATPGSVLAVRDDTAAGHNYLCLRPDGRGHLFGVRWGGSGANPTGGRLVVIDYSASGRLDDTTTRIASAPIPDGLAGCLAIDTSLLGDGFDRRG